MDDNLSSTTLTLSGRGLRIVPLLCSFFEHVTILEVDDNLLTILSPSLVKELPNLEKLDVARNKLKALPDNIGDWVYLKEISAPFNCITYLPPSMSKLTRLNYLNLEGNPLNPVLCAIMDFDRKWNYTAFQHFARNAYLVAAQLPNAVEENCRTSVKFDFGCNLPCLANNKEKPALLKKCCQTSRRAKSLDHGTGKAHNLTSNESDPCFSISAFKISETNPPSVLDSASIPSGDFGCTNSDFRVDEGIIEESKTILNDDSEISLFATSVQLTDPPFSPATDWSAYNRELMILLLKAAFGTVKSVIYALCFLTCAAILSGMYMDGGVLDEFLNHKLLKNILPDWFRDVFITCHDFILPKLIIFCDHFPIYRSFPKTWLLQLLSIFTNAWAALVEFFYG